MAYIVDSSEKQEGAFAKKSDMLPPIFTSRAPTERVPIPPIPAEWLRCYDIERDCDFNMGPVFYAGKPTVQFLLVQLFNLFEEILRLFLGLV